MENNQGLVTLLGAGFLLLLLTRPQTQAVLKDLAARLAPQLVPLYHYVAPVPVWYPVQTPKRISGVF
jgi:hypothetical protein